MTVNPSDPIDIYKKWAISVKGNFTKGGRCAYSILDRIGHGLQHPGGEAERKALADPAGLVCTPSDVAEAVIFLAGDQTSGWVTGATLNVSGGAMMGLRGRTVLFRLCQTPELSRAVMRRRLQ